VKLLSGLPRRHYGAILADPPWHFRSYAASANPESDRSIKYRTMTPDEIKALPIGDLAAPGGCHLFLWATGPQLPLALDVMRAWGFDYSGTAFVWLKLRKTFTPAQLPYVSNIERHFHVGLGFTTRKNAEFVLLGRRGNARRLAKDVRELIFAPVREHSRKPDEVHERIERYCAGPFLELWARKSTRQGWTFRGDECDKFNKEDLAL
jgi:N6-adenosine-specific RNA methylase IME4